MKPKPLSKKLILNKVSISNLEMREVKGMGTIYTDPNELCYTMYKDLCWSDAPQYCPTFAPPRCTGNC
jgi:hypothetical protein